MEDFEHFRIEAAVAKRGVVPGYDEVVLEEADKMVTKHISWRTSVVQAIAKAAELPELKGDEEMIIVVRRNIKEE